ncbi:hypothetical protein ACFY12_30820 [Streptomyces sp. NPDC001339]
MSVLDTVRRGMGKIPGILAAGPAAQAPKSPPPLARWRSGGSPRRRGT